MTCWPYLTYHASDQFEAKEQTPPRIKFSQGSVFCFKLIRCIISEIRRPRHFPPIWVEIVELDLYQETRTKMVESGTFQMDMNDETPFI